MSELIGSLEVFALPDVFRLLSHNKVTGALKVGRESGDGVIYFREGEVYFAFSSLTREFLGQRLVNAKLITQGQLLRILDEQKKNAKKRLGDLLIDKGILSPELLDTFIKEQIQDAIFNLLQWDMGQFDFVQGEVSPQEIGLSVSVENLLMESSRRLEEWEVIQRKIPSLDVVVRMSPTPPEDAMEINIKPEEWTLLVLADGVRTVRDIAAATERSEFEACKIIYGLVTAGLLDVARGAHGGGSEEPSRMNPREMDDLTVGRVLATPSAPVPQERAEPIQASDPEPIHVPPVDVWSPDPAIAADSFAEDARAQIAEEAVLESSIVEVEAEVEPEPERESIMVSVSTPQQQSSPVAVAMKPSVETRDEAAITKETLLRLIAGVRNL